MKLLMSLILVGLSILQAPLALAQAQAENGARGGDDISLEFRSVVRNLPQIVFVRGVSQFSDIDLNKFQTATQNPNYQVELRSNLTINGAQKVAISYPGPAPLTILDPDIWFSFNFLPDGELRKDALAFHEVLVTMGIEGNDDYHDSDVLLTKNNIGISISSSKKVESVGQITSFDYSSPAVITAVNYTDKTSIYYYCDDRKDINSCHLLGRAGRYYSQKEVSTLKSKLDRKVRWYGRVYHYGDVGAVGLGIGFAWVTEGVSLFFAFVDGIVNVAIGSVYDDSRSYDVLVDPRIQTGQNIVVHDSTTSSDTSENVGLKANARDLNQALMWLN